MVRKKLENGKVIIKDMYGIYSFITEGVKKVALVGCKDIKLNEEDARNHKVVNGENRPWCDDWSDDYKTNLTRAEAKAIIRHKAKEIVKWEEEHQMMCPWYFCAKRKLGNGEHDYYLNNPDKGWRLVEL